MALVDLAGQGERLVALAQRCQADGRQDRSAQGGGLLLVAPEPALHLLDDLEAGGGHIGGGGGLPGGQQPTGGVPHPAGGLEGGVGVDLEGQAERLGKWAGTAGQSPFVMAKKARLL